MNSVEDDDTEITLYESDPLMGVICGSCDICEILGKQVKKRILAIGRSDARVLVIDDNSKLSDSSKQQRIAKLILGDVNFIYTVTIRCKVGVKLTELQLSDVVQKCSVWTNQLTSGRSVVLATKQGLQQMKVNRKKEVNEGDMFRSIKWGLVLCIPPLELFTSKADVSIYRSKASRLLKEAGLHGS